MFNSIEPVSSIEDLTERVRYLRVIEALEKPTLDAEDRRRMEQSLASLTAISHAQDYLTEGKITHPPPNTYYFSRASRGYQGKDLREQVRNTKAVLQDALERNEGVADERTMDFLHKLSGFGF